VVPCILARGAPSCRGIPLKIHKPTAIGGDTIPNRARSLRARRPRAVVIVETLSVIAFTGLLVPLLLRLVAAITTPDASIVAIAGALIGYLAADAASGIIHWFCDRFLEEDTPVIGPVPEGNWRQLVWPIWWR
jgi:hypothetical protein